MNSSSTSLPPTSAVRRSRDDALPASLREDGRTTQIVLVFCTDLDKDPVSAHVLEQVLRTVPFEETDIDFDGLPVLVHRQASIQYHLVRLQDVLSHHYARYAPPMNTHFSEVDAIILINWHQGAKAPNAIFTVQTTGDMGSGHFSRIDPALSRRLFLAVEQTRQRAGLNAFSTWMEATHWSGAERDGSDVSDEHDDGQHASALQKSGERSGSDSDWVPVGATTGSAASIHDLRASVIDLEIGSSPEDWANPAAAAVLAQALFILAEPRTIANDTCHPVASKPVALLPVLCIGGIHFEPGFTQLMHDHGATQGLALSHILPNHWLVAYGYDSIAREAALAECAASIVGGIRAVVFHDNLKGSFKARVRHLAESLGVPALSHKKLRTPDIAKVIQDAQTARPS